MKQVAKQIEAVLFYTGKAVKKQKLATVLETDTADIQRGIATLKKDLADRSLEVLDEGETVRLVVEKSYDNLLEKLKEANVKDLTSAQAEALTVVAYLASAHKHKIDFIRGVNSRAVLRNLSTRGLIKKQHDTYKLTQDALAHLGITDTSELPDFTDTRDKLEDFAETSDLNQDTQ